MGFWGFGVLGFWGSDEEIRDAAMAGEDKAMDSSHVGGQLSDEDFLTNNGLLLTPDERNDLPDRVNRKVLPEHKKIIVLENAPHQAEAYAGNLIGALRDKENMVRVLSLSVGNILGSLLKENPDLVLIQDNDETMEEILRTYAGWINANIPVLYYPNLDHPRETLGARPLTIRPNLSVPGNYIEAAQEAIRAHQSQYPREEFPYRRPYDKVAYFTSLAMARIARYLGFNAEEGEHANNLVVVEWIGMDVGGNLTRRSSIN